MAELDQDFRNLLKNTPMDEIKRPPPLPGGTYHGQITKHGYGKSPEKGTPFAQFEVTLTAAGPDIDQEELNNLQIDLTKKKMTIDFYLTNESMYRVKEAMESCGIDTKGRFLEDTIPEMMGKSVIVTAKQSPNKKNPQDPPYVNLTELKGDPG